MDGNMASESNCGVDSESPGGLPPNRFNAAKSSPNITFGTGVLNILESLSISSMLSSGDRRNDITVFL